MRQCIRLPKRYTAYIGADMMESVNTAYRCLILGNKIWPRDADSAHKRLDYFLRAEGELETLSANISIVNELAPIEKESLRKWTDIINEEFRLIAGVKKKDKERWKQFFENEP